MCGPFKTAGSAKARSRFQPGDKVRLKYVANGHPAGSVGTVTIVGDKATAWPVAVDFGVPPFGGNVFSDDELEAVETSVELPARDPKYGDKVTVLMTRGAFDAQVIREGVILQVREFVNPADTEYLIGFHDPDKVVVANRDQFELKAA